MKFLVTIIIAAYCLSAFFCNMLNEPQAPRWYDQDCQNIQDFTIESKYPVVPELQVYAETTDGKTFTESQRKVMVMMDASGAEAMANKESQFHMWPGWFMRQGGLICSGFWWNAFHKYDTWNGKLWNRTPCTGSQVIYASFFTLWLAGLLVLYLVYRPHDSWLLCMVTLFALFLNFGHQCGSWWRPWDVTSMFWAGWSLLEYQKGRYWICAALAVIGSQFMETVAVMAVALFLAPNMGWIKRTALAATVGIGYGIPHLLIAHAMHLHSSPVCEWSLLYNLRFVFSVNPFPFFLTNGGTLLLFFFAPIGKPLKLTAAAFVAGEFIAGHFDEVRDWFCMIPFGAIAFCELLKHLQNKPLTDTSPVNMPFLWLPFKGGCTHKQTIETS